MIVCAGVGLTVWVLLVRGWCFRDFGFMLGFVSGSDLCCFAFGMIDW